MSQKDGIKIIVELSHVFYTHELKVNIIITHFDKKNIKRINWV